MFNQGQLPVAVTVLGLIKQTFDFNYIFSLFFFIPKKSKILESTKILKIFNDIFSLFFSGTVPQAGVSL